MTATVFSSLRPADGAWDRAVSDLLNRLDAGTAVSGATVAVKLDLSASDVPCALVISAATGEKMFMIIDEFQNIMMIDEGDEILNCMEEVIKEMRTSLKAPFSYIMCGSMINAMKEIFVGGRHFFYRWVEHV